MDVFIVIIILFLCVIVISWITSKNKSQYNSYKNITKEDFKQPIENSHKDKSFEFYGDGMKEYLHAREYLHDYFNNTTYDKLLHNDKWNKKRNIILERDNYTCKWCGKTNDLQVHHKYYAAYPNGQLADPWDYPDNALITLCNSCHNKAHTKYKIKTYRRSFYKSNI